MIRPLDWYIYYIRGSEFYYLTNASFANGRSCSKAESSCLVLETVENHNETLSKFYIKCLNATMSNLLTMFERREKITISLDEFLDAGGTRKNSLTIVEILNYLIENRHL